MKVTSMNFKKVTLIAIPLIAAFLLSTTAFAQEKEKEEKAKSEMKDESKKMTWEEYRNDVKDKYRKVMEQADRIQEQATEKLKNNPEFKEELEDFQSRAKRLGERLKDAEVIAAEKQESFKKELKEELSKLDKSYDELKERWEKINK
jgi:hypothetical protein